MGAHSPLAMLLLVTPYTMVYLANQCKEPSFITLHSSYHQECHTQRLMSCEA